MEMDWNLYLNFFAAMLAIVNPMGIWPIWSELTSDGINKIRKRIAIMVMLTAYVILVVFLVSGKMLLNFFSIDIEVFRVAGGILLLYTGISMVQGSATELVDRKEEGDTLFSIAKKRFRKIIVPLAIPVLAGPGSITTVTLFGVQANTFHDFLMLAIIILFVFFFLFLLFINSEFLEQKVDDIVFTVITRIFGIIVTAIAIQFMVEGLGEIFPNWLEGQSVIEDNKNI